MFLKKLNKNDNFNTKIKIKIKNNRLVKKKKKLIYLKKNNKIDEYSKNKQTLKDINSQNNILNTHFMNYYSSINYTNN